MRYLHDLGVPVPEPIWASWQKHGFYYRAALATERVLGARTLASTLNQASPRPVARAIKKMHNAGVFHADLNAFNILLDAEKVVCLIAIYCSSMCRQAVFAHAE